MKVKDEVVPLKSLETLNLNKKSEFRCKTSMRISHTYNR